VIDTEYDVVVVGAGPGGSITAKNCAERGMKTLMVEKRQMIGDPVRCAEGIAKHTVKKHIEPNPKWICAEAKGFRIFSPSGIKVEMVGEFGSGEVGYVLDRKLFDRALAHEAARSGATILVKTRATGLLIEDGKVCGVELEHLGKKFCVRAKVVVGADGVESKVGRWAGMNTSLKPRDIETCAQALVYDPSADQEFCEFYLGREIAPGGYAWIFPKGEGCANVGLGILGSFSDAGAPFNYLNNFLKKYLPNAKILEIIVGGVPVSKPTDGIVGDGIVLVGDAARQSDPLTGGGIGNAMEAGAIAGEVVSEAISEGDTSAERLREYEERWFKERGKKLMRNWLVKEHIMSLSDEELDKLAKSIADVKFKGLQLYELLKHLLRRNPKLLWKLKGYI